MLSLSLRILNGSFLPTMTSACVHTDRGNRRRHPQMFTVMFCLLFVVPSRGDVSQEMVQSVEKATELLSERFQGIRRDILGADALAEEYKRVGFDYTPLDINYIFSSGNAAEHINTVLGIMTSINASSYADASSIQDCCSGSSRPEVCCHGCSIQSSFLSAITDAFSSDPSLVNAQVELEFGHVDGTLLRFPTPEPPSGCRAEDSNLQPWYINMVRTRPLEVVLLLDLNVYEPLGDSSKTVILRHAAASILDSLTLQDKVQVILLGMSVKKYRDESGNTKTLPVCSSYLSDLRNFILNMSPPLVMNRPAEYTSAFNTSFNTISDDPSYDKLIVFFTNVKNLFVDNTAQNEEFSYTLRNVSLHNAAKGNTVAISAYYVDGSSDPLQNIDRLEQLVKQNITGEVIDLEKEGSENAVRNYYNPFNSSLRTENVVVERDVNRRGYPSLSLSLALKNDTELVGIFHAKLPWELLFTEITGNLNSGRGHSSIFIMNEEGDILYHPLVPGNFQSPVSVASIESQDVLDSLMSHRSTRSPFNVSTTKQSLTAVSVRSEDKNSFVSRQVPVTYTCKALDTNGLTLYACVALAEEDEQIAKLKNVNDERLYSNNEDTFPVYHTTDIPKDDQCFYFCSISTNDAISVQLTGPSQPPADVDLATINEFIRVRSVPPPSWAVEGVANELAVLSVVKDTWRNVSSNNMSEYVIRRHLATPSGLYLTFPFTRLSTNFTASQTEWFVLSSAHPHTLTLTPPRLDALREGGYVVSAGVTLSTPPQENGEKEGGLLAVVAADFKLPTLRALLEDSMPLCRQDDYRCFLLDDQGNILYHEKLLEPKFQADLNRPMFLVRPTEYPHVVEFRTILVSILNESVAFKYRCIDYMDQDVRQRLFFSFDLDNDQIHAVSSSGIEYVIQNIPETNVFLGIVRQTKNRIDSQFCFCTKTCQTCENNEQKGCECPCQCPEDCKTPHSFPACPLSFLKSDQLARGSTAPVGKETIAPFCSTQDCSCKTNPTYCDASRDCHWCSQQDKCLHVSECCSGNAECCTASPFDALPSCMRSVCTADVGPPSAECVDQNTTMTPTATVDDSEDDGSNNTASIVGGILGGLLAVALIGILAGFFLWHQFCRKGLYEDEQKDTTFDFSKTKLNAKNPVSLNADDSSEQANDIDLEEKDTAEKKDPETTAA